jgi:ADP-heptose:LPS heptosyltransferase
MAAARARTGPEAAQWLAEELAQTPPLKIFAPGREHFGDVVNLTGPLRALRNRFPDAHITAEVGERTLGLLQGFPYCTEIWARPTHQGLSGKFSHISRLRKEKFDLAVLLDDSNDLVLQAKLGGIPRRVGIWRGKKYENLFDAYVPYQRELHEVRDHGAKVIELLGGQPDPCQPCLFPSNRDIELAEQALEVLRAPGPLIGIHPGSADPKKKWGVENLAATAKILFACGARVVLLGSANEEADLKELNDRLDGRASRLPGELPILAFGHLLSRLKALICMDSGPMHLCAALGGKVVAVYGPTYLEHSSPAREGHALLHRSCPCPVRASKSCSGECFRQITPHDVASAALRLAGESR